MGLKDQQIARKLQEEEEASGAAPGTAEVEAGPWCYVHTRRRRPSPFESASPATPRDRIERTSYYAVLHGRDDDDDDFSKRDGSVSPGQDSRRPSAPKKKKKERHDQSAEEATDTDDSSDPSRPTEQRDAEGRPALPLGLTSDYLSAVWSKSRVRPWLSAFWRRPVERATRARDETDTVERELDDVDDAPCHRGRRAKIMA